MGTDWLVMFNGGQYYASPNYVQDRLYNWTLKADQNGTILPGLRVPTNSLIFIKTVPPRPPLFGPEPQPQRIGL